MAFVSTFSLTSPRKLHHQLRHQFLHPCLVPPSPQNVTSVRRSIHKAIAEPSVSPSPDFYAPLPSDHPNHVVFKDDDTNPPPRNVHDNTDSRAPFVNFPELLKPSIVSFNGQLPSYLHRLRIYRVGLGRITETHSDGGIWQAPHLFEILSMLCTIQIDTESNTALFLQRLNSKRVIDAIRSTPKSEWNTFKLAGTKRNTLQMIMDWKMLTLDEQSGGSHPFLNYNVLVEKIPGYGLVTRTDVASAQLFDRDSLRPGKEIRFEQFAQDQFKGLDSAVSHGLVDPNSGDYFNVIWNLLPSPIGLKKKSTYKVFRMTPAGDTQVLATIKHAPKFMHSFAATKNYVIIIFPPTRIIPTKFIISLSLGDALQREDLTTFVVVSKNGDGVVGTFTCNDFPVMHCANSFEDENGNINIDVLEIQNLVDVTNETFERIFDRKPKPSGILTRVTLPLGKGGSEASTKTLYEKYFELPIINPRFEYQKHNFVYGITNIENVYNGGLRKVDIKNRSSIVFKMDNCVLNEPCFIPDPDGVSEDDGSLLLIAFDTMTKTSKMVVLDAVTLDIVASTDFNKPMPLGFHNYLEKR